MTDVYFVDLNNGTLPEKSLVDRVGYLVIS